MKKKKEKRSPAKFNRKFWIFDVNLNLFLSSVFLIWDAITRVCLRLLVLRSWRFWHWWGAAVPRSTDLVTRRQEELRPQQSMGTWRSCYSSGGNITAIFQLWGAQQEHTVSMEHMHILHTQKIGLDKTPSFFQNTFEAEFLTSIFCIITSSETAVPSLFPVSTFPSLCLPAEPTAIFCL